MSEVDRNPAPGMRDLRDGSQTQNLETDQKPPGAPWEEGDNTEEHSDGLDIVPPKSQTREPSLASPRLSPAPDSTNLSIQLPPSPSLSVQLPSPVPSFEQNLIPSQAAVARHSLGAEGS